MAIGDVFSLIKTTSIPNAATSRLLHFLLPAGVIDSARIKIEGANTSANVIFNLAIDGAAVTTTELTMLSGTNEIEATGLAETVTNDQFATISIDAPFTSGALDDVTSIGVHVTYVTETVNLTGAQTVAGVKDFTSSPTVPTPTTATQAANKSYVDGATAGLSWKQAVRVATAAAGTLATGFDNGSTVDGVAIATGDRILIKDQASATENGIYCLDSSTEIFTKSGFKHHSEVAADDIVLTLNLQTGQSEWQALKAVHVFPVENEDVLVMENSGHSSLSTLNHRWPVSRNVDGGTMGYRRERVIRESCQLSSADSIIVAASCSTLPTTPTYSDTLVELIAWFASEGHIRKNNSSTLSNCIRIVQSEKVNADYVNRIEQCLRSLWGDPTEIMRRERHGEQRPEWRRRIMRDGLICFDLNSTAGKVLCEIAPEKVTGFDFINSLTWEQLRLFVDIWVSADGHQRPNTNQRIIIQKSMERLEPVRFAATLLGIHTTLSKAGNCFVLNLGTRQNKQPHMKNGPQRELFTGLVWCPETDNGTWFARRNNTVYFTGNTVAASGAPTRATDADSGTELVNASVYASEGTANADKQFVCTTNAPITIGATNITFTEFSSGGGGDALVANPLSQFAATTSAQLAGVLSDETGTGLAVFNDTPTLIAPVLGTPTSGTLTNCTGLPTAGILDDNVTLAKIANAAANSKLVGSGDAGAGANYVEISLGTNLSMSGTTLNAAGGSSVSGGSFDIDCGDATGAGDFVINCGDAT